MDPGLDTQCPWLPVQVLPGSGSDRSASSRPIVAGYNSVPLVQSGLDVVSDIRVHTIQMIQTLFGTVPQEPSLLDRLKAGIEKTRTGLVDRIEDVISGKKEIDADVLDELEYTLITADIGVKTTQEILEEIRLRVDRNMAADMGEIKNLIREHLLEVLQA